MKIKLLAILLLGSSVAAHNKNFMQKNRHAINCSAAAAVEAAIQKGKVPSSIAPILRLITFFGVADLAAFFAHHQSSESIKTKTMCAALCISTNYAYAKSTKFKNLINTLGLDSFVKRFDLQTLNAISTALTLGAVGRTKLLLHLKF